MDAAFINLKETAPKVYEKYAKEAKKLYGEEISSNLLGEQILEEKIKELIYQRMNSGEQVLM